MRYSKVTGEVVLPFEYDTNSMHWKTECTWLERRTRAIALPMQMVIISAPVYLPSAILKMGMHASLQRISTDNGFDLHYCGKRRRKGGAGEDINPLQFHYPDYKEDTHRSKIPLQATLHIALLKITNMGICTSAFLPATEMQR